MKKSVATTASAAALALAMWMTPGSLQGQPLYDRIHVTIPYTITLGEKTLQPGDYTIQQLPDNGGGSRVLLFYTDNGMKFETSAMTIPALDPNTARDTKLVLNHVGEDYYISKIWVQGKDYGYELPIPDRLKLRENEKMTQSTVTAQYQPSEPAKTETKTETAAAPPAQATPPPVTSQTEARPAETPRPLETQPTQPAEQPATPDTSANSADRAMTDQSAANTTPATMPNTASNWVLMLLSGAMLSGVGVLLRRKLFA
jgi:hypothetical protein